MSFQDRYTEAIDMQKRFAIDIYKQVWPGCEVLPVDEQETEWSKKLDYSGVDKIILIDGCTRIDLPQRFRNKNSGSDFTIRCSLPNGKRTEAHKLAKTYKEHRDHFPKFYALGVYDGKNKSKGFEDFYIINLRDLWDKAKEGHVNSERKIAHGSKEEFAIFEKEELARLDLIHYQWTPKMKVG